MNRALFFLLWRSLRGRVWLMLRRLKEPRYLIGAVVAIGWIWFWVGSRLFRRVGDMSIQVGAPPAVLEAAAGGIGFGFQTILGVGCLLGLTLWWLIPFGKNSLQLSEAELHLLLPAPVRRRQIIQYGLLRGQPGVMLGAAIFTFLSGVRSIPAALAGFAGLWVFLSLWDLHGTLRGMFLANLAALPPAAAWRRRLTLLTVLVLLWVGLAVGVTQVVTAILLDPPDFSGIDLDDFDETTSSTSLTALTDVLGPIIDVMRESWLGILVRPFVWLTAPLFLGLTGAGFVATAQAWLFPILLLVLHHEWIVRSQTRFEESTMAAARKRSRQADPAAKFWRRSQRSRRWHPFGLRAGAAPEIAVAWKNVMLVQRMPLLYSFGAGVALFLSIVVLAAIGAVPSWMAAIPQVGGAAFLVIPPLFSARGMRNDLRTDLLRLEMVRPWPLAPSRMFLAQLAAPVLIVFLQVLFGGFLLLTTDLVVEAGLVELRTGVVDGIAAGLGVPRLLAIPLALAGYLPLALVVATLTASLENLAALLFPGWVQLGMDRRQAASQFGHHIVIFMVLSIALFVALLPGVAVAGLFIAVQLLIWGVPISGWELPLIGLLAAAPIGAVVVAIAGISGGLWARFDPSEELLARA